MDFCHLAQRTRCLGDGASAAGRMDYCHDASSVIGISGTAELCPLCMNDRFQSEICVHADALFGKDAGRDDSGYRELRTGEVKLVVRVSSLKASLL